MALQNWAHSKFRGFIDGVEHPTLHLRSASETVGCDVIQPSMSHSRQATARRPISTCSGKLPLASESYKVDREIRHTCKTSWSRISRCFSTPMDFPPLASYPPTRRWNPSKCSAGLVSLWGFSERRYANSIPVPRWPTPLKAVLPLKSRTVRCTKLVATAAGSPLIRAQWGR